jgi:hypothetical protein
MIYRVCLVSGIACGSAGLAIATFSDSKYGPLDACSAILCVVGLVLLVCAAYHSPEPISLRNYLGLKKRQPPSRPEPAGAATKSN